MSVLCPDKGPPRLLRLVGPAAFSFLNYVSVLDRENNLLRVRQDWWDENSKQAQELVLRTEEYILTEDDFPQVELLAE